MMDALFDPAGLEALRHDMRRRFAKYSHTGVFWKIRFYFSQPQYRALFWHRLAAAARPGVLRRIFNWLHQRASLKSGLEILTPRFGGGVIMPHWGRIVLNAEEIGEDLYVFHNVTIGNDYRTGRPTLGRNIFIGTGSVLMGRISIGDNVIIGACSLVNADVPANSLVAGNPARVVRSIAPDEIQQMIGY